MKFDTFLSIALIAIIAGFVGAAGFDYYKGQQEITRVAEWKENQHQMTIKACTSGKTTMIMYNGEWCKK